MEMLWENASPSSIFDAQTLNINYQGFEYLMIVANGHVTTDGSNGTPSYDISGFIKADIGASGYLRLVSKAICFRKFTLTENGISFDVGKYWSSYYSGNPGNTIDSIMPRYIFGFRGIK